MRLPGRILFVGAHCDDVELVAGGLLARACYRGCERVGVLVFSDHRGVVDEATGALARAEMTQNVVWLARETGTAITDHTAMLLPACRGAFEAERERIYAALERLRGEYDLVVSHADSDTNQDHQQVAREARRVFKADATLWGGEFPSNDVGDFTPKVYVPIAPRELEAKVHMIERYASQRTGRRPYLDGEVTRALARVRGAQIHAAAAEAFSVESRVVVEP
jgi:LmbE family N-acetylglucosaminyl deacetylase